MRRRSTLGLSLFWRTFFLLAVLLTGGVFAWLQTLRALELEPRAVQSARQTAGLVNLARASLKQADGINRVALVKTMAQQIDAATREGLIDQYIASLRRSLGVTINPTVLQSAEGG